MTDVVKCKCGADVYLETDDMITMGETFEVWYSMDKDGTRRMSCSQGVAHRPPVKQIGLGEDRCQPKLTN